MLTAEIPHIEIIGVQILDKLVQPRFSFVVSRLGRNYSEWIDIAYFIVIDGTVDSCAAVGIGADDVRNLQSGYIECLAGRYAGNGMSQKVF